MSALVSRRVRTQWRGLRPIPGEFVLFISKTGRRIQQSDTKFYLEKAMPTGRRFLPPPKAWEASNITFWNRKGAGFLSLKLPADVWIPSVPLMGRHFERKRHCSFPAWGAGSNRAEICGTVLCVMSSPASRVKRSPACRQAAVFHARLSPQIGRRGNQQDSNL